MLSLITACLLSLPPDVIVSPPLRDLGELRAGVPAACSFDLVNRGTKTIELADLERSCGCVEPTLSQRTLAPNERATLTLKIRTLGQPEGPRSWPLTLVTRSGETVVKHPLEVRATIRNEIVIQPPQLALYVSGVVEQDITLTDRRARPLRVEFWKITTAGTTLERLPAPAGTTRLKLTVDGSQLAPGRHETVIRLQTDDPQYGQLEVPLTLVRTTPAKFAWTPQTPEVILAPGQNKGSTLLTLRRSDGEPVTIHGATGIDAGVTCSFTVADDGRGYVRVAVDRQSFRGSIQTGVRVTAGAETISIPILVRME